MKTEVCPRVKERFLLVAGVKLVIVAFRQAIIQNFVSLSILFRESCAAFEFTFDLTTNCSTKEHLEQLPYFFFFFSRKMADQSEPQEVEKEREYGLSYLGEDVER